MKKRVFVLVTVLTLVGILAAGTTAMAAKPPANPVELWQATLSKVSDIWDLLTGSSGMEAISTKLDSGTKMDSGSVSYILQPTIPDPNRYVVEVYFTYPEVRQINVTAFGMGVSWDDQYTHAVKVTVYALFDHWSGGAYYIAQGEPGSTECNLQFAAKGWRIRAEIENPLVGPDYPDADYPRLYFSYTTTYTSP